MKNEYQSELEAKKSGGNFILGSIVLIAIIFLFFYWKIKVTLNKILISFLLIQNIYPSFSILTNKNDPQSNKFPEFC